MSKPDLDRLIRQVLADVGDDCQPLRAVEVLLDYADRLDAAPDGHMEQQARDVRMHANQILTRCERDLEEAESYVSALQDLHRSRKEMTQ